MSFLLDGLLVFALLWSGGQSLASKDLTRAVVMFMVFGLLLALVWARLAAPDIALAEAAIGAGLTGALLLDALGALRGQPDTGELRRGLALLALLPAGLLAAFMLNLPSPPVNLAAKVSERLAESGVQHPVTAVLLNFRGFDTLLEVAVLLLALVVVLAVGWPRVHRVKVRAGTSAVQALARVLLPLMVVVAGYLLWAGAFRPGGAFQAAAVLAAALVLWHLAGRMPPWAQPGLGMRLLLSGGLLVFLGVAVGVMGQGALLAYPPAWAGVLILLIEAVLTFSLGAILAGAFLFLSGPEDRE